VELERRRHQVAYVKTPNGQEVDFVARNPLGKAQYIQVCSDLTGAEVCKRELDPLREMLAAKTTLDCLFLTMTTTDVAIAQKDAPSGVRIRPVWEWLLEKPEE
jgi:predicted AAA+ superfamily ATPase